MKIACVNKSTNDYVFVFSIKWYISKYKKIISLGNRSFWSFKISRLEYFHLYFPYTRRLLCLKTTSDWRLLFLVWRLPLFDWRLFVFVWRLLLFVSRLLLFSWRLLLVVWNVFLKTTSIFLKNTSACSKTTSAEVYDV